MSRLSQTALIARIEMAGKVAAKFDSFFRAEMFVAALCGALDTDFPELARALAKGSGVPELQEKRR